MHGVVVTVMQQAIIVRLYTLAHPLSAAKWVRVCNMIRTVI